MRLIASVVGFALRKLGVFGLLLLSLFLVTLLHGAFTVTRDAVADRQRLQELPGERAALEDDLERLQSQLDEVSALEIARDQALSKRDKECGLKGKIFDLLSPGSPCRDAAKAVEKAETALAAGQRALGPAGDDGARQELEKTQQELEANKRQQTKLERDQKSGIPWLVGQWLESWRTLTKVALLALVMPPVLRAVSYFLLMPIVTRMHKPVDLAAEAKNEAADLRASDAQRTMTIDLGGGERLSARSEYVRPVQGKVRSRLLYEWKSPVISFAAGLYGLSRVTGEGACSSVTLAPGDPDAYLMRLDFQDHPGVVMHPKHVVGVLGEPDVKTRWRWGIQSLATWQVRYILFAGTGGVIVEGGGDVKAESPQRESKRMNQNLVMGFDSRLTYGIDRTEVFWPYLRGKTPLADDKFTGPHAFFWQKSTAGGASNPVAKVFGAFFSSISKLLGF